MYITMKEKQIRKWIVGWFVLFGVVMLVSMAGAVWAAMKQMGGDGIESMQRTLQFVSACTNTLLPLCLIGLGWVLDSSADKLAQWGGGALAVSGFVQVLNQCVAIYLLAASIETMALWATVIFALAETLTACAAVLLIAKYYSNTKLYNWALAFCVGQIGVAISTVWINANPDAKIMALNLGLCSLIVTISQIVYMVLWYKHLKFC
jgi:hypothetical protein